MPNTKTHLMHMNKLTNNIPSKIEINKHDMECFSMGPDLLAVSDERIFNLQHLKNTKYFFEKLINKIKEEKLYKNPEIMAFLYGQIDHFILDSTVHPLVYYMSNNYPKKVFCSSHSYMEDQIEKYLINKYNVQSNEINKWKIDTNDLRILIDEIYNKVYNSNSESIKYDIGILLTNFYNNTTIKYKESIGDISARLNIGLYLPFNKKNMKELLNLNKDDWFNPYSGDRYHSSFDDLWNRTFDKTLEVIECVNKYLYDNKELNCPYIFDDISYDTGIECKRGNKLKFCRKYIENNK